MTIKDLADENAALLRTNSNLRAAQDPGDVVRGLRKDMGASA